MCIQFRYQFGQCDHSEPAGWHHCGIEENHPTIVAMLQMSPQGCLSCAPQHGHTVEEMHTAQAKDTPEPSPSPSYKSLSSVSDAFGDAAEAVALADEIPQGKQTTNVAATDWLANANANDTNQPNHAPKQRAAQNSALANTQHDAASGSPFGKGKASSSFARSRRHRGPHHMKRGPGPAMPQPWQTMPQAQTTYFQQPQGGLAYPVVPCQVSRACACATPFPHSLWPRNMTDMSPQYYIPPYALVPYYAMAGWYPPVAYQ